MPKVTNPRLGLNKKHGSYVIYDVTDYVKQFNFPNKIDALYLKTEFHVSLIKFAESIAEESLCKKITEASDAAAHFLSDNPPRFNGKFLRVFQPEKNLESIIGLVDMPDLEKWRDSIRKVLGQSTVFSVPHVTLYTKQPDKGIALNSQREFDERTRILDPEIVGELREYFC